MYKFRNYQDSQDYNILDFAQDKIRKITNIKYN